MAQIITVSINEKQKNFLQEAELSPSELIQEKINEKMAQWQVYNTQLGKVIRVKDSLEQEMWKMHEFLDYIGKSKDYSTWRGDKQNVLEQEKTN